MALVSRADVKTYLGISGAGDDGLLDDLIASAESIVAQFTHRTFDASSSVKKFDAEGDVEGATLYFSGGLFGWNKSRVDGQVLGQKQP